MLFRRRRRKETTNQETNVEIFKRRYERVKFRTERRAKRRAFFIGLTSNIKWIMLGLAIVVVIAYLWFGSPLGLIKGLF